MTNSLNLAYLKGFFEAASASRVAVTLTPSQVADLLACVDGAISEASVIPALPPAQIPLFPTVPFSPDQPSIFPNPFQTVKWPEITSVEKKYSWVEDRGNTACEWSDVAGSVTGNTVCSLGTERHDMKYGVAPDPFELDVSAGSAYQDPLPTVSADKLVAIMSDIDRANKLNERKTRSAERTKNYGRPLPGHARD